MYIGTLEQLNITLKEDTMGDLALRATLITLAKRIATLECTIIEHPTHKHNLQALQRWMLRSRIRVDGASLDTRAKLLCGDAGAGKTTLIRDLQRRYPDKRTEDGMQKRVLVATMPTTVSEAALVKSILRAMGYTIPAKSNAEDMKVQIAKNAKRLGTHLIIMDEGHNFTSKRKIEDAGNFFKNLLNEIECQLLFAGLPEIANLRDEEQYDRRAHPNIHLAPYDWRYPAPRIEFMALMAEFEKLLLFPERSDLSSHDMASRLYIAAKGHVGLVVRCLSLAVELATWRNEPKVSKALLAEAFASWERRDAEPEPIDFDEELSVPKGYKIEDLQAELLKVEINDKTNPFACSRKRLKELWNKHCENTERQRLEKYVKQRAKGRGADPVAPFSA